MDLNWVPAHKAICFSLRDLAGGVRLLQIAAQGDTTRFLLQASGQQAPEAYKSLPVIQVPVTKLALALSPAWGALERVGGLDLLAAISVKGHALSPAVRSAVESGRVLELGQTTADARPEVLARQGIQVLVAAAMPDAVALEPRLKQAGVQWVPYADFLEADPVGRAEWIRVIGALAGKDSVADVLFRRSQQAYDSLKTLAATLEGPRPMALWGSPYMGVWYLPGGRSYAAQLVRDAGMDYVYASDSTTGSTPLTMEQVLRLGGGQAQVWVNPDFDDRAKVLEGDARYGAFAAIRGPIWKSDKVVNPEGGRLVFEEGPLRPELMLEDLLRLSRPKQFPQGTTHYFRALP